MIDIFSTRAFLIDARDRSISPRDTLHEEYFSVEKIV
jgi:hypothetical protein